MHMNTLVQAKDAHNTYPPASKERQAEKKELIVKYPNLSKQFLMEYTLFYIFPSLCNEVYF